MVKYKNFGALLSSKSKASVTKRLPTTQSSSISNRTAAASHQLSDQRVGSESPTNQQDYHEEEDNHEVEQESISMHSSSVKSTSHRQKRQHVEDNEEEEEEEEEEEDRCVNNKNGGYRMVEEREPSSTRGSSGHHVQHPRGDDSSDNTGQSMADESWNTTPTVTSSSRRAEKVSVVSNVPSEEAMSIHNMDDDALQLELHAEIAAESRNLRRQRLAKKYGQNDGNFVLDEDNFSFGSDAAASIVQTYPLSSRDKSPEQHPSSQALSSHPTTTVPKKPIASPLRSPTRTNPTTRVEIGGAVTPSSSTAKGLQFLAKKRRNVHQDQSGIDGHADQQPTPMAHSLSQQILHQVDERLTMLETSPDQPFNVPDDDRERQASLEQFATTPTSSSGMSDSLRGSDIEDGSSSRSSLFPDAGQDDGFFRPGEECLTFENSSPAGFQHSYHRGMAEYRDQEEDESATNSDHHHHVDDDPSAQFDLFEHQRPEFPHTPLQVIEEASNAHDFDNLQRDGTSSLWMRHNPFSKSHYSEINEDADFFFSLHQHIAIQDSLSTDEVVKEDVMQVVPVDRSKNAKILRKSLCSLPSSKVILKFVFVFVSVVMYYSGFIFNVWKATDTFLQQQLNVDIGHIWSLQSEDENDVDWQHLTRLVQEALGTYHVQNTPPHQSLMEVSVVSTRNPRKDWERELDEALFKHKSLLHRVKTIIRRHGNSHGNNHDDSTTFFRDEELAKELRELKKEKNQPSFGGSRQDDNVEEKDQLL